MTKNSIPIRFMAIKSVVHPSIDRAAVVLSNETKIPFKWGTMIGAPRAGDVGSGRGWAASDTGTEAASVLGDGGADATAVDVEPLVPPSSTLAAARLKSSRVVGSAYCLDKEFMAIGDGDAHDAGVLPMQKARSRMTPAPSIRSIMIVLTGSNQ
jgi:hypothetical protein